MKERELQKAIIEMAGFFGWRIAHFRTAINARGHYQTPVAADGAGFPDLCLVRDRIVFAEIKVGYNKLSTAQEIWRDAIIGAGGEWFEWREANWESGAVEEALRRKAP
jgi:hypothetical protein